MLVEKAATKSMIYCSFQSGGCAIVSIRVVSKKGHCDSARIGTAIVPLYFVKVAAHHMMILHFLVSSLSRLMAR